MKTLLRKIFNRSSLPLYAVNEALQIQHKYYNAMERAGLEAPGPSVYDLMPFGAQLMHDHASSFAGAVAMMWVGVLNLDYFSEMNLLDRFAGLQDFAGRYKNGIAMATSGVCLTAYECKHMFNDAAISQFELMPFVNSIDWKDMAAYAVAMSLFYVLNKDALPPQTTPVIQYRKSL